MITQNNKIVESMINEKNGGSVSTRRFAAYSIMFMLGITFCLTALVLNGGIFSNAFGGEPSGTTPSNPLNIVIWSIAAVLTVAYIILSVFFILRRRKQA